MYECMILFSSLQTNPILTYEILINLFESDFSVVIKKDKSAEPKEYF